MPQACQTVDCRTVFSLQIVEKLMQSLFLLFLLLFLFCVLSFIVCVFCFPLYVFAFFMFLFYVLCFFLCFFFPVSITGFPKIAPIKNVYDFHLCFHRTDT